MQATRGSSPHSSSAPTSPRGASRPAPSSTPGAPPARALPVPCGALFAAPGGVGRKARARAGGRVRPSEPPPSRTNWTRLVPPSRTNWTRLVDVQPSASRSTRAARRPITRLRHPTPPVPGARSCTLAPPRRASRVIRVLTGHVRLLREEGRGVSSQYGREGGAKTWFMSGTPQRARPGRVRKREATSATQSSSAPPAWTRRRGCLFSSGFLQRSTKLLRSRIGTMLPAARDGKQCCVGPAPPREQRRRRPRSRSGSASKLSTPHCPRAA